MTDDFIEWIMFRENAPLATTEHESYIVHNSPEGGTDTVGYGHKLSYSEEAAGRIGSIALLDLTEEDCRRVLVSDLENAWSHVDYDLDQRRMEMLTDFVFNLGSLDSFPKFTEAVIDDDLATQREEYERFYTTPDGKVYPLVERNSSFYARYLADDLD